MFQQSGIAILRASQYGTELRKNKEKPHGGLDHTIRLFLERSVTMQNIVTNSKAATLSIAPVKPLALAMGI